MLKVNSHCFSFAKQLILITVLCFTPICFAQEAINSPPITEQSNLTSASSNAQNENTQPDTTIPSIDTTSSTVSLVEHDLSPWGMYQNADIVVKIVMIGLLLASFATWTIFIAKLIELLTSKKQLRQEMASLRGAKTLRQAQEISGTFTQNSLASVLVNDIQDELELSANSTSQEGIKERAAFRQDRLVAASGRQMNTGTSILATIGSVSPFVGLFGTVWGIMNSFIGIAQSQTTNLAVVAPGIAEALLATAMGLVAAIPAVIIYNTLTRSINHYRVMVSDISAQALLLLSRDLDRKSHTVTSLSQNSRPTVTKIGN